MRQHLGKAVVVTVALLALTGFGSWQVADMSMRRSSQIVGAAPQSLGAEQVAFRDTTGRTIKGWAIDTPARAGTVLLLHGIRSTRLSQTGRARFLAAAGYDVLMIDLQAHGESEGERISFGFEEARSAAAAIRFARQRWPYQKVAIIGTSLGGASAVLAAADERADAYVLEGVFASLEDAVRNRMRLRLGQFGDVVTAMLLWQVPVRFGVGLDWFSIADKVTTLDRPVFVLGGGSDTRTPPAETELIHARANGQKRLWILPGARHQNLHHFAKSLYEDRIKAFLGEFLK